MQCCCCCCCCCRAVTLARILCRAEELAAVRETCASPAARMLHCLCKGTLSVPHTLPAAPLLRSRVALKGAASALAAVLRSR